MLKMADLIKTALNEVGCEELPSGCDDISVDPTFIENSISNNDQQPVYFFIFCAQFYKLVSEFSFIKNHLNSLLSKMGILSVWGNVVWCQ